MFFGSKIKISYVVIAYNREQYIKECIDSILAQNIEKEIICIDDCSTDKTYEILEEYAKQYKEIKLFRNEENKGTVYTRSIGLSKCTGEYMLFVDSDDKLIGKHEKLYDLAREEKTDILEFSCETDGADKFKAALMKESKKYEGELILEYSNRNISNQLWNKLVSKKVYKKVVGLLNMELKQANFSDVIYFMYHFLNNSYKLVSTELKGYYYYDNRGMTANISLEDRLKEYCGFKNTKLELEYTYGETKELDEMWRYVSNQAVAAYLDIEESKQENFKPLLYTLMPEEIAELLIEKRLAKK